MNETHLRYVTRDVTELNPAKTITLALTDARQCGRRAVSALGVVAGLEPSRDRQHEVELLHSQLQYIVAQLERLAQS